MPYQPSPNTKLHLHNNPVYLTFFLFSLVIIASGLQAQQVVFDKQICDRRTSAELSTITDSAKEISCTIMLGTDSVRAIVFNNKMEELRTFRVMRQPDEEPLGSCINNGIVYYYLKDSRKREVHTWSFNYSTGETTLMFEDPEMLKDRVIAQVNTGNHFLYCTINKKTNSIAVYDFQSDSVSSIIRYSSPTLWDELTHTDGLLRDVDFVTVPAVSEAGVDIASCFKKFYVAGDSLCLLSNRQNGITQVYVFNLLTKSASHRTVQHELSMSEINPFDFKNNSFLLGDKLYYIWVNAEKMGIEIADFQSGKVLKKYGVTKDEDITFKNTPIIQEGGGPVYFSVTRELDATSKLLRKMHRGRPVIAASPSDSGRIAILVGSYIEATSAGPSSMGFSPVGGTPVFLPTSFFFRNGAVKSARFKMLTDQANEFVPGDMLQSLNEKIEAYTDEQKLTINSENLFTTNSGTYYVYYYKKEGRLVVMKWQPSK